MTQKQYMNLMAQCQVVTVNMTHYIEMINTQNWQASAPKQNPQQPDSNALQPRLQGTKVPLEQLWHKEQSKTRMDRSDKVSERSFIHLKRRRNKTS